MKQLWGAARILKNPHKFFGLASLTGGLGLCVQCSLLPGLQAATGWAGLQSHEGMSW